MRTCVCVCAHVHAHVCVCVCVVSADTVLNSLKYLLLMTDIHRKLELTSTWWFTSAEMWCHVDRQTVLMLWGCVLSPPEIADVLEVLDVSLCQRGPNNYSCFGDICCYHPQVPNTYWCLRDACSLCHQGPNSYWCFGDACCLHEQGVTSFSCFGDASYLHQQGPNCCKRVDYTHRPWWRHEDWCWFSNWHDIISQKALSAAL
jgi:hypothetical protein